jgi:hypothetical protein
MCLVCSSLIFELVLNPGCCARRLVGHLERALELRARIFDRVLRQTTTTGVDFNHLRFGLQNFGYNYVGAIVYFKKLQINK